MEKFSNKPVFHMHMLFYVAKYILSVLLYSVNYLKNGSEESAFCLNKRKLSYRKNFTSPVKLYFTKGALSHQMNLFLATEFCLTERILS